MDAECEGLWAQIEELLVGTERVYLLRITPDRWTVQVNDTQNEYLVTSIAASDERLQAALAHTLFYTRQWKKSSHSLLENIEMLQAVEALG